jgi:hypothetical protein
MNKTISLSHSTIVQLELWGYATANLFGKLRSETGIPDDQLGYWAEPWLTWEKQADQEIQNGQIKEFNSMDGLIASLD